MNRFIEKSLRPILFLQEQLELKIRHRLQIDKDAYLPEDIRYKKAIAYRVEFAELLNALRYHDYWSTKTPESDERILEEYADALHMILSMAVDRKIRDYEIQGSFRNILDKEALPVLVDDLFRFPWLEVDESEFLEGIELYFHLGYLLDFTYTEIIRAYTHKNIENHERQERYQA